MTRRFGRDSASTHRVELGSVGGKVRPLLESLDVGKEQGRIETIDEQPVNGRWQAIMARIDPASARICRPCEVVRTFATVRMTGIRSCHNEAAASRLGHENVVDAGRMMGFVPTSAASEALYSLGPVFMRILITYENLIPLSQADAEQFVNNAMAMSRRGHHVDFLIPEKSDRKRSAAEEVRDYYQVEGPLHVDELPSQTWNLGAQHLYHAMQVPKDPRFRLADFVYTRNLGMLTSCLASGQKVLYEHYRPWGDQFPPMQVWLRRVMTHPNFLGMILHSDYAKQSYLRLGIPDEQLCVCHNGWEPKRMEPRLSKAEAREKLGLPRDRRIVVYTGRMNHKKGLDIAIEMARRLPEHLFVLVGSTGDGPVEREAATVPNIRIVEWQPFSGTAAYLYAADVVLVPPSLAPLLEHGNTVLPIKLFIYLASGRPILAADSPDIHEILRPEHNAVLVRPGDVDGATSALASLLAAPERMERLGEGAWEEAKSLTWDSRAARIESFVEGRLKAPPAKPGRWSAGQCLKQTGEWISGFPKRRWVRTPPHLKDLGKG